MSHLNSKEGEVGLRFAFWWLGAINKATNRVPHPASWQLIIIMADHANDGDADIFVFRGGRAPQHVTHVLIDKSVNEIEDNAFWCCDHLVQVDTHDGIRRVGRGAFWNCASLRRINLKSAAEIDNQAFYECGNLDSVEFGDRLETIGYSAFDGCKPQRNSTRLHWVVSASTWARRTITTRKSTTCWRL